MTTKIRLLHDTVGIPTGAVAVTQSASDNTTKVATTAYVTTALANLADSAPSTLNTLNELAAALGDDANFSTTVTNSIATKAPLATPQFTNRVGIGVAAHGTAALNITSTAQHMRLNNGSELGVISLESDGALRLWSHGDSSNNEIEFYQGSGSGSPSMTINGSGNLGIGTNNPRYLLEARKDIDSFVMKIENDGDSAGTNGASYADASDGLWVDTRWNTATNTPFKVTSNSGTAPMMIIKGNGNVGIGTTSPSSTLDVTVNGDKRIVLNQTGASQNSGLQFKYAGTRTWDIYNTGYAATPLYFYSQVAGASAMTLTTGGNVGIGTVSPSTKLTVRNDSATTSFGDNNIITLQNANTTDNSRIGLAFTGNTGIGSGLAVIDAVSYDQSAGHTSLNFSVYNGSWHDDMMVLKAGKVGIGTGNPLTPLHVVGANGLLLDTSGNGDGSVYFGGISGQDRSYIARSTNDLLMWNVSNGPIRFGTNNAEAYRIRPDGGLQFPDNNTFIATSNVAGGTAYEWGSIRRPASSDGGQLSIRQYSTGDTAANYPAYAGGTSGWDENTGMFFYNTDQVGFTAGGNPTLWVEDGKKHEVYESGFTSGDANRGQRVCLGGISHVASTNPGGTGSGTYMHIKTNLPHSNIMFRFEYKGLSYDGQNMDTSIIGYTYAGVSYVHSCQIQDTGNTTYNFKQPYYSSDSKLVLVLQIANNYTGGVLWFQTVGSHAMAPGTIAIASCAYSNSTSGAF